MKTANTDASEFRAQEMELVKAGRSPQELACKLEPAAPPSDSEGRDGGTGRYEARVRESEAAGPGA
ncbi:hypothetical protein P3T40_007365 [Paraburkholderia sp. EB58]|uniref:hypothetical protein n=1 Tax=Paraburkholderia sp. EB58 TaxID=3035125 RepID=UPI003D1BF10B